MWAVAVGAGTAAVVAAGVVWASFAGGGLDTLAAMMREPLYIATLIDVYAGCVFVLAWIWVRHRSLGVLAAWTLAMLLTGNIGAGVYVAIAAWRSRGDLEELMLGRSRPSTGNAVAD
jgi:hypothetical protein